MVFEPEKPNTRAVFEASGEVQNQFLRESVSEACVIAVFGQPCGGIASRRALSRARPNGARPCNGPRPTAPCAAAGACEGRGARILKERRGRSYAKWRKEKSGSFPLCAGAAMPRRSDVAARRLRPRATQGQLPRAGNRSLETRWETLAVGTSAAHRDRPSRTSAARLWIACFLHDANGFASFRRSEGGFCRELPQCKRICWVSSQCGTVLPGSASVREGLQESATVQMDLLGFVTVRGEFAEIGHSAGGFAGNGHSAGTRLALRQISANPSALRLIPANPAALWRKPANPFALKGNPANRPAL